MALHCEFGTHLEEALRDRFVCGLKNEAVQKRLLTEADLTLARAVTTAQSMEAADRNAKSFKTTDSIAIRKVSTGAILLVELVVTLASFPGPFMRAGALGER